MASYTNAGTRHGRILQSFSPAQCRSLAAGQVHGHDGVTSASHTRAAGAAIVADALAISPVFIDTPEPPWIALVDG